MQLDVIYYSSVLAFGNDLKEYNIVGFNMHFFFNLIKEVFFQLHTAVRKREHSFRSACWFWFDLCCVYAVFCLQKQEMFNRIE